MPTDIKRIAILGVGLIGGSLGLSWQEQHDDLHLIGFDQADVCRRALSRGAVDEVTGSLEEAVTGADLVVMATPLSAMLRLMEEMSPHLEEGTLVIDVGSVKKAVADQAAEEFPETVQYVGGHPMAGSEKNGVAHADPYLFQNATYVVCPPPDVSRDVFVENQRGLLDLIRSTGANILLMGAERHDRIAAAVSHLPQLLAVTLADMTGEMQEDDGAVLQLAAGGFRDMTRIASSPYDMWREIFAANFGSVLDVMGQFTSEFQRLRGRLVEEDFDAVGDVFDRARQTREQIPRNTKGFLHPLADLYVYAKDQPGELADITRTLHEAEVNIKDIELLNVREDTGGVFRMGFSDDETAQAALEALQDADYDAHQLDEEE